MLILCIFHYKPVKVSYPSHQDILCPTLLYSGMIKHSLKARRESKIILCLRGFSPSLQKEKSGNQSRNIDTGTNSKVVEECCFMSCSSDMLRYSLDLPAQGCYLLQWKKPPKSISNQEKTHTLAHRAIEYR